MRKKDRIVITIIGIIVVFVLGVLSHFAYEWLGNKIVTAFVFATNESIFQHMKIFVFPYLAFGIVEYFIYGKELENFIPAKVKSLLLGTLMIPVIYYTYSGILGYNLVWVDMSIYVIAVITAFIVAYKNINNSKLYHKTDKKFWVTLLIIFIGMFVLLSYFPLKIGMFIPPN